MGHELVRQLQFPPGYRFVPSEEQLVDFYLRRKIEDESLPLKVVNEVSILNWTPDSLVERYKGYGENKWYFFTKRDKSSSNKEKEPSRKVMVQGVTASWKATGSTVPIMKTTKKAASVIKDDNDGKSGGGGGGDDDDELVVVGSKRVLTYQSTDPEQNGKWSMHEYILQGHDQIGQYSLCSIQRILHSKRHKKKNDAGDMDDQEKCSSTEEEPSSEAEGVQLQHPGTTETTLADEPPLKPTGKINAAQDQTTTKGKEEPPMQQAEGEGRQQAVVPAALQQEEQQLSAAYGAPPPLPVDVGPLQAVAVLPSSYYPAGGITRASTPMHEEQREGAIAGSFQCDDIVSQLQQILDQQNSNPTFQHDNMSQFLASEYYHNPMMLFNNQQEQASSSFLTDVVMAGGTCPDTNVVNLAQLQQELQGYGLYGVQNQPSSFSGEKELSLYMMGQYNDQFLGNTTQLMSAGGWEHDYNGEMSGQHRQICRQDDGGVFVAVQDQDQQRNYQCYYDDDQYFKELSSLQVDLFAHAGSSLDDEQFINGFEALCQDGLEEDSVPTQEGSDDLTGSERQHEQLRCSGGQLQDVVQGHTG